ncbi:MAG: hypothetical protein ABR875_02935 [Minisyncoccia bacterium]
MRKIELFLLFVIFMIFPVLGQDNAIQSPITIKSGDFSIAFKISDEARANQRFMDLFNSVADALKVQVENKGLMLTCNIVLSASSKTPSGKQLNGLMFTIVTDGPTPKSTYFPAKDPQQTPKDYQDIFSAFLDNLVGQIKSAK